ncbi:alpha/beta hydrolase fold family protein [Mycobacterium kansasii 732]|uniref:Proline iminopeptidase n=1 Tax=Mycobacterium pseudokansasii TaxID=2341080 RepID=A0A498QXI8_9MYCO|nr:alpha/beta hydrolase [Mycobacterium pseudokansasii]EUA13181.1 alpha/beta hydrolase fold family protein [Mycobacterium kansasii 732]MBY0387516.1 alpha/beta hydrolase [Mycobacterium pseudokansasii]VAZ99451.1 Proline iminopeptidase [Mycobacterium pseudokansasii]VBA30683.1 Proline iminopeptidase [Mycobacterium pseudokansasii]VBA53698.1 Proline iminopeptidase [Mycobacterium pseudokansasii]
MVVAIARPKIEGNIAVGEDRQIGFAEFGAPQGRAVFWLHGTPGARRQIPTEARVYAEHHNVRLIGVDRPGIGSSTPHQYETISAFADDMRTISDTLGIEKMAVVGLSGGGPYTLACAAGLPDKVVAAGVLGGVAPTHGPDAISGGVMNLGVRVAPLLRLGGSPLRLSASLLIRAARPVASPALDVYALLSPQADRHLLARPEFKAMFLDDLLNGSRKQLAAPFADVIVFARDWGFRLEEVTVPVRWWHGDHDHIIPFSHGEHVVSRLPNAELFHLPGESHLAGLGRGEEILATMMKVWDEEG